eukprot:2089100-Lingulodinium_polyedra.AAC.1
MLCLQVQQHPHEGRPVHVRREADEAAAVAHSQEQQHLVPFLPSLDQREAWKAEPRHLDAQLGNLQAWDG